MLGMDNYQSGFLWVAGQGGFGIQTAPAVRTCFGLALELLPLCFMDLIVRRRVVW